MAISVGYPDVLEQHRDGQNPLLYAACQLYWAGLNDLVEDSVDPTKQLRLSPRVLPRISAYLLHESENLFIKPFDKDRPACDTSHFTMASWVIRKLGGDGYPYSERQFQFALKETSVKNSHRVVEVTEYVVGQWGVCRTGYVNINGEIQNIRQDCNTRPEDMASVRSYMSSPASQRIRKITLRGRSETQARQNTRLAVLSTLPDPWEIDNPEIDCFGNLVVEGVVVPTAAEQALEADSALVRLPFMLQVRLCDTYPRLASSHTI